MQHDKYITDETIVELKGLMRDKFRTVVRSARDLYRAWLFPLHYPGLWLCRFRSIVWFLRAVCGLGFAALLTILSLLLILRSYIPV